MSFIFTIAAIVISILVFTWLIKVVKATVTTALTIAIIVFALYFFFGIGPVNLLQQIGQTMQTVWTTVTGQR
jgi:ABC-type multidrug transport system permease subunit